MSYSDRTLYDHPYQDMIFLPTEDGFEKMSLSYDGEINADNYRRLGWVSLEDLKAHQNERTSYGPCNGYGEQDNGVSTFWSSIYTSRSYEGFQRSYEDVNELLVDIFGALRHEAQQREEQRTYWREEYQIDYSREDDNIGGYTNPQDPQAVALYEGQAPNGTRAIIHYYGSSAKVTIVDYSPVLHVYYFTREDSDYVDTLNPERFNLL